MKSIAGTLLLFASARRAMRSQSSGAPPASYSLSSSSPSPSGDACLESSIYNSSLHITMSRSFGGKSAASSDTGAVSDDPSLVRVNEKNGTSGLVEEPAEDVDVDELESERERPSGDRCAGCTVSTVS